MCFELQVPDVRGSMLQRNVELATIYGHLVNSNCRGSAAGPAGPALANHFSSRPDCNTTCTCRHA